MDKKDKIYIAGHNGMVGSSIIKKLQSKGYTNLIYKSSKELDLRCQKDVNIFFQIENPQFVFIAAAKVGGIIANNTFRAEFIYDNLVIQSNLINASKEYNVKKLLFLGSSCIYPKNCKQPIKEKYLLRGSLERTNEPYAIAKIAGLKLCESYYHQYGCEFISLMPTNLYGPNDNYDLKSSHVLPALIRKFHEAKVNQKKEVIVWGDGTPRREFLHVDDLADACLFSMNNVKANDIYDNLRLSHINIGTGIDITIKELAQIIKGIIKYDGEIIFDTSKPNGTPQKLLDMTITNKLGWSNKINFRGGLTEVINQYVLSCN
tara:strand:- start:606 stop:1559 length:954 start_codon:yes stop_codon:yes gene_type:complete